MSTETPTQLGFYQLTHLETGKVYQVRILEWPMVEFLMEGLEPLELGTLQGNWEFQAPLNPDPQEALKILDDWLPCAWLSATTETIVPTLQRAVRCLQGSVSHEKLLMGMTLLPNPAQALACLRDVVGLDGLEDKVKYRTDLIEPMSNALGFLKGYQLSDDAVATYVCGVCKISGVKLWRAIHDGEEKWCAKCAMAQAGLPDDIDEDGRNTHGLHGERDPSDQVYNPDKGLNLLPCVPSPEGRFTWGYTSVPPEGCVWWRAMPTRLVSDKDGVA